MSPSQRAAPRRLSPSRVRLAVRRITALVAALPPGGPHPDAALLAACAEYGRLRSEIDRSSQPRMRAEDPGGVWMAALLAAGRIPLEAAIAATATTPDGHRARAALYLAWDEGDLITRARTAGILEDRLLATLLVDLVTS